MNRINSIKNSVDEVFIKGADRLVKGKPIGYVINPGPVETKTSIFKIFTDIVNKNCVLVLEKFLDGTGVFVRYYKYSVRLY